MKNPTLKATWYTLGSPYEAMNRDQTERMLKGITQAREKYGVDIELSFSRNAPMKTFRPVLEVAGDEIYYLHDCTASQYCNSIVSIRKSLRRFLNDLEEREKPMEDKKTKRAAKKCTAQCDAPAQAPKVPNKTETKALVSAFKKAAVSYGCAALNLSEALIGRGDITAKSPIIKKLAKAREADAVFCEKLKELGY